MNRFEQKIMIKETQLDFFGHVNNAHYLQIFEEARWEMIDSRDFGIKRIQETKTGPVILECNIKFIKELKARDQVTVTVESITHGEKDHPMIYKLKQQIINAKGEIACEAVFTYALFDLEKRKLIMPTPEWKKAVGQTV